MSILAVILFAAILHASWNAFIKNKGNGFAKMVTLASIISLMMVPFLFYVGLPSYTAAIYLFFGVKLAGPLFLCKPHLLAVFAGPASVDD